MPTWEERMGGRPVRSPKLERLEMLWRIQAPTSGREYECVLYRTEAGLELRLQRTEDDVLKTQLLADQVRIEMT
jgi:hypothetical protein